MNKRNTRVTRRMFMCDVGKAALGVVAGMPHIAYVGGNRVTKPHEPAPSSTGHACRPPEPDLAAAYWVAPEGWGDGSYESPDSLAGGEARASAGSILGCRDGVYTEPLVTTKSGEPGNLITFIAERDGGTIIDRNWAGTTISCQHDYREFIGFTCRRGGATNVSIRGDYNVCKRIAINSCRLDPWACMLNVGGRGNLIEDCFAWGSSLEAFGIDSAGNILRRCIARLDACGDRDTVWGFRAYNQNAGVTTVYDNCIVIDSVITADTSVPETGAFRHKWYSPFDNTAYYYGCIALNNTSNQRSFAGWQMQGAEHVWLNCLSWGNSGFGYASNGATATNVTGALNRQGFESGYVNFVNAKDGISGLIYPCRHDSSGNGCTIEKRHVDGELTEVDLWPFPHQDRIRSEMRGRAYIAPGYKAAASPTRGFCTDGETLTHYIWNQLGNGSPY